MTEADIDAAYAERDRNALAWVRRGRAILPVMTTACCICRGPVDLAVEGEYHISRVNGDSMYGYEPYHVACL